jgi:hypothetical protein
LEALYLPTLRCVTPLDHLSTLLTTCDHQASAANVAASIIISEGTNQPLFTTILDEAKIFIGDIVSDVPGLASLLAHPSPTNPTVASALSAIMTHLPAAQQNFIASVTSAEASIAASIVSSATQTITTTGKWKMVSYLCPTFC